MRHIRRTVVASGAIGILAVVALSGANPALGDSGPRTLHAGMNGSREVPGPGDTGASGKARVSVDTSAGTVCWELTVRKVSGAVTGAHIHAGDRSHAGPVVQALSAPTTGTSSGCAANAALAAALADDPASYYVNVHSTAFPAGAVRGQLAGRSN